MSSLDKNMKLTSKITCPYCGFPKEEKMPADSCQIFYKCQKCGKVATNKKGDCCVCCSYGDTPCPPMQKD
jgi:ribosomal protein L37E